MVGEPGAELSSSRWWDRRGRSWLSSCYKDVTVERNQREKRLGGSCWENKPRSKSRGMWWRWSVCVSVSLFVFVCVCVCVCVCELSVVYETSGNCMLPCSSRLLSNPAGAAGWEKHAIAAVAGTVRCVSACERIHVFLRLSLSLSLSVSLSLSHVYWKPCLWEFYICTLPVRHTKYSCCAKDSPEVFR